MCKDVDVYKDYCEYIKETLDGNFDVVYREFEVTLGKIYMIFADTMIAKPYISQFVIAPIVENKSFQNIEHLKKEVLYASIVGDVKSKEDAVMHILSGDAVLLFDFNDSVIYCEAKSFASRSIGDSIRENVIKGPHEAFNELLVNNISLIRKRVKNPDLKFESIKLGKKSNTPVVLAYIKGVTTERLVDYIRDKIESIDQDMVLESNYIEEHLKSKGTVFDTVGTSERPDKIASRLMEGRVAILVESSPQVITAPHFFPEAFMASEDYYTNKYFANYLRIIRWMAFGLGLALPGLYIAICTYHFSFIPTSFIMRISTSRAGVPFPTVVEVIGMMFVFQLLREAGVRLPAPTGQAMSIVGALVLGDAVVGASLASQSTIIVVALSSISTFLVPDLYMPLSIWSMIITVFSSVLGLPGFYMGFFVFLAHVAALESCGYPYLYPLGSLETFKYNDVITRGALEKISNSLFQREEEDKDKSRMEEEDKEVSKKEEKTEEGPNDKNKQKKPDNKDKNKEDEN